MSCDGSDGDFGWVWAVAVCESAAEAKTARKIRLREKALRLDKNIEIVLPK
jgi:hypothetical protein